VDITFIVYDKANTTTDTIGNDHKKDVYKFKISGGTANKNEELLDLYCSPNIFG